MRASSACSRQLRKLCGAASPCKPKRAWGELGSAGSRAAQPSGRVRLDWDTRKERATCSVVRLHWGCAINGKARSVGHVRERGSGHLGRSSTSRRRRFRRPGRQHLLHLPVNSPPTRRKSPCDRGRTAEGGRFKRDDPTQRWVPESLDPIKHVRQAIAAGTPPEHRRGGYQLSESLKQTMRIMLDKGLRLGDFRESQLAALQTLAHKCEPLTARLRQWAQCPAHVERVAHDVNVGLLVVMIEASGWPDHTLPLGFLQGMNVVGLIEDSGIFRPLIHDESLDTFLRRREDIASGRTSAPGNVQASERQRSQGGNRGRELPRGLTRRL
jgi:hypothetical protein